MTTQFTPILKLALPVTGELSGTWGDVVNDNITSMIEQAIAGLATISTWSTNSHTLSTANGTSSESRCAMVVAQDGAGLSAAGEIICPASSKLYVLKNATSYAITLKTASGTGVAVASGETAFLFCDGVNVNSCVTTLVNGHVTGNLTVDGNATVNGNTTLGNATSDTVTMTARVASSVLPSTDNTYDLGSTANSWKNLYIDGTAAIATLNLTNALTTANGGTGLSSWTAGDLPYYASGTALSKLGIGTSGQVLTSNGSAPSWTTLSSIGVTTFSAGTTGFTPSTATSGAVTLAGTLATTNGGTGLTSFTAKGVVYASSTSALTTGSALTFDGTKFGIGGMATQALTVGNTSTLRGQVEIISPAGSSPTLTLDYTAQSGGQKYILYSAGSSTGNFAIYNATAAEYRYQITDVGQHFWQVGASEQMRLTSTGLGIGTSSPSQKLDVTGNANVTGFINSNTRLRVSGGGNAIHWISSVNDLVGSGSTTDAAFGAYGSFNWYPNNGTTLAMKLDSSGNLGLGVTPSAWWSNDKALHVLGGAFWSYNGDQSNTNISTNSYQNSSNAATYMSTQAAAKYTQAYGAHSWYTAPSGTAGTAITFTQAMTLNASGNLGIGTTSPTYRLQNSGSTNSFNTAALFERAGASPSTGAQYIGAVLKAKGTAIEMTDGFGAELAFAVEDATSGEQFIAAIDGVRSGADNSGALLFKTYNAGTSAERMRLDSSGNLGLGVTPSAWSAAWSAIDIKGNGSVFSSTSNAADASVFLSANMYSDGTSSTANAKYKISSEEASMYRQFQGVHAWYTAPSGTAGAAITFTQAMTLDANGRLFISAGASAPNDASGFWLTNQTGIGPTISGLNITFQTGGTGAQSERVRIDSSGNLLVGTTTPITWSGDTYSGTGLLTVKGAGEQNVTVGTTDTNYTRAKLFATSSAWGVWHDGSALKPFVIGGYSSTWATIDTSGNLGLGVTPSAWTTFTGALEMPGGGSLVSYSGALTAVGANHYYSAPNFIYKTSSYASRYVQSLGAHYWYTAPSGTAGNAITFTQAMTLSATGGLNLGSTSDPGAGNLSIGVGSATNAQRLAVGNNNGATIVGISFGGVSQIGTYTNNNPLTFGYFAASTYAFTEFARIDSLGNLLVGTTSTTFSVGGIRAYANNSLEIVRDASAASTAACIYLNKIGSNDGDIETFYRSGTKVGSISVTGTATAYNTSSDYRLKNITGPITNSGAYIDSLNPVEGTWKADGSTFVGLIAHEVQEVSRTSVATGVKDGPEMQGMDYSSAEIIANLIAEVKSLRARLAAAGIA